MAYQLAVMGAGVAINAVGKYKANIDQAAAEEQNASWYREQATFAKAQGERQRSIFDRETVTILGAQASGFAKAGADPSTTAYFFANEMLSRQNESNAIKMESDMNVRLAMLRADQASKTADALKDPLNNAMQMLGPGLSSMSSVL